jgi:hypothetical protein
MHTTKMIETNPSASPFEVRGMSSCIDACFDCAQTCAACADACLGESQIDMLRRCIRLNEDCRDICIATGSIVSRQQQPDLDVLRKQLESCALVCATCASECEKHADKHEHCRICAEACRACERACSEALSASNPQSARA